MDSETVLNPGNESHHADDYRSEEMNLQEGTRGGGEWDDGNLTATQENERRARVSDLVNEIVKRIWILE